MRNITFSILFAVALLCCSFAVRSEATIYIFDNFNLQQVEGLYFNGDKIPLQPKEIAKVQLGQTHYHKAVTKCVVKNEGRLVIVRDFIWYEKPFHDEMTIDINDGDVYYLELFAGVHSTMKLLKTKDGEKALQKVLKNKKSWRVFDDIIYDK